MNLRDGSFIVLRFERADTVRANIYRFSTALEDEKLAEKTLSAANDSYTGLPPIIWSYFDKKSIITCNYITPRTIFGESIETKKYTLYGTEFTFSFSKGFGLTKGDIHSGNLYWRSTTQRLVYAIINGIEYGTPFGN